MLSSASEIANKAIEAGFDKCGIIPVEMMSGYEEKLEERIAHFPQTREKYGAFRSFAHLQDNYSWAKAVVICSFWYGKYHIPDEVQACPTGSLEAPYRMCRNTCVSCLTTWDGWDLRSESLQNKLGKWDIWL